VWAYLKEYINEYYPGLKYIGTSNNNYDRLCDAIEEAWDALDQDKIDNLIKSMPRRVAAVIHALGWHTKY
jgi:hypothetical protein